MLVSGEYYGWKEVLGARDEVAKERCMEVYEEEKRKVKKCIYQSKNEVNETVWKEEEPGCKWE